MARWGVVYGKRSLIKDMVIFLIMVVCMYPTQGAGFAVMWAFAISALMQKNHERLLLVMILTVGVLVGNSKLMPKGAAFHIEQKSLMMFLAATTAFLTTGGHQSPIVRPFLLLLPYIIYIALPSALGWNPLVSYLKIILFISCFFAFYGIANTVILGERVPIIRVRSVFLSLCCFSIFGSILLIPFPGISQMMQEEFIDAIKAGRNVTSLFKGIMYHSQALGPLSAMLGIALFSDLIMSIRKPNKLYLALLVCAPILIYKTSSRTAMGTLIAGMLFALYLFMRTRQVEARWKSRVLASMFLVGIVGGVLLCFSGSGREAFSKYVLKSQGVTTLSGVSMDDVLVSRQGLMDRAMFNFRKSPVIGNGFQVSKEMSASGAGGRASLLSAPVEKGVWVTAVLEEGGVVGMILFVGFALLAIPMLIKRKAYTGATLLFSMYIVNLGEFTFFSMSGIGGYYWALCFMGVVLDAQRLREEKIVYWIATPHEIEIDPALNPYA